MSSVTQKNPIRLFVCHVWQPDDDYLRVFEYLESVNNFFYRNTSTPDKRPAGDKEALREDLRRQINEAEAIIVPSQLYRKHMDWVEFQLHCAKAYDKPAVLELGDEVVPWDKRQLVDAIKRQARHEETTRFDTIEFKLD